MSAGEAILLTAPGSAAIAVVRLRGPGVGAFLREHFSRPLAPGRCVHGELRDGDRVIDDAVVVVSHDGGAADINLHGGTWVVHEAMELARRCGFEVIDKPEPPLPAAAVDATDPIEAEVLACLPLARTELAVRALLAQRQAWHNLSPTADLAAAMLQDQALWWLLHPPRVAIVGEPNVGKSTLANQLFGQARSITADVPGTTRDWVGELADLGGLVVMLVDTPGLRTTDDAIERAAIDRARQEISQADLAVQVLDVSAPLRPRQGLATPCLLVANKADLPPAWDPATIGAIPTAATAGWGIDALRARILAHFGCADLDIHRARWWTQRQRNLLAAIAGK